MTRILYISNGQSPDYQCDMLFHGLRLLYGSDVVDHNFKWYMYVNHAHTIYSVSLPDTEIDRTDISEKIRTRYYDYVFYGSIHRCRDFWDEVFSVYPRNQIVLIDGEDETFCAPQKGLAWYFKRELASPDPDVLPIQFAIPREKIVRDLPAKFNLMAPLIPGDLSTYIYPVESEYYRMYSESYFGRTRKKGGWDCCRHYEIMLSGCLPYFEGLESCPPTTMVELPKDDLFAARRLYDAWSDNRIDEYNEILAHVHNVLESRLTTEALAKRVLEIIAQ
jgi:hypothetical protein